MYAIIVTGGKQYRVEQGDIVYIEKLDAEADSEVKFDQVLAIGEEGSVKVGAPVVEGATVSAKVIKNGKGSDDTLFALVDGTVRFERVGKNGKKCSVKQ